MTGNANDCYPFGALDQRPAAAKYWDSDGPYSRRGATEIIGESRTLQDMLAKCEMVAPTACTALILGETGTGKELVARMIHNRSPRRDRAFVKVNCAAIPLGLLESELFGHERGAFTGALAQRIGRFELADKGTLFLDEVGDIPTELQPKLLRVLQEQEFERLGGTRTVRTDVRLIAATHRNLTQMVGQSGESLLRRRRATQRLGDSKQTTVALCKRGVALGPLGRRDEAYTICQAISSLFSGSRVREQEQEES